MNITLKFNPAKATYGFLFDVVKFTKSSKILEEIKNAINKYDLSTNFVSNCRGMPETIESNEISATSWKINIKAMIVLNKHSSYAVNYVLAGDEDLRVRAFTAQFTRFTSLITFLSNNSEEPKVLMGLLRNYHLNRKQFDIIYKRLIDGLLETILLRYYEDDWEVSFIDCLLNHSRMTEERQEELLALLEKTYNKFVFLKRE